MGASYSLQRLTTQYVAEEDRLRVAGEVAQGQTQVLWLTQRLLVRLLPPLLQGIAQQQPQVWQSELVLGFQQDAARAALEPQAPVVVQPDVSGWLVDAVDVVSSGQSTQLRFRVSASADQAEVTFDAQALRQWLGIVHDQFVLAQWPMAVWPEWMGAPASATHAEGPSGVLH